MPRKAVFCIASNETQAAEIVDQLKLAGFCNDDISALLPDKTGTRDFAHERHTKASEGVALGVLVGGVLGAAAGWLVGIGVLAIPNLAPFIAAGPILACLSGAAIGMVACAFLGAFIGLGLPEYEARRYQGKTLEDNILLSVHCDNNREARRARNILRGARAQDIGSGPESLVRRSGDHAPQPTAHAA